MKTLPATTIPIGQEKIGLNRTTIIGNPPGSRKSLLEKELFSEVYWWVAMKRVAQKSQESICRLCRIIGILEAPRDHPFGVLSYSVVPGIASISI